MAGSGKTTVVEAIRTAFEAGGYTVLRAATSGQAARTLAEAAGVESRTVASLRSRLAHGKVSLDSRTVIVLDETGMTDDADLLAVLATADAHRTKVVDALGSCWHPPAPSVRTTLGASSQAWALVLKLLSRPRRREKSTGQKLALTRTYSARSEGLEPPTF